MGAHLTTRLDKSMKSSIFLLTLLLMRVSSRSIEQVEKRDTEGDCMCLERSEDLIGNLIKGQYKYIDPVGSLIEVNYSMNPDKTNYVEDRRVYKNYKSSGSSSGLTAEQVVEKVLTDITPTVISVVQTSVQGSQVGTPGVQERLVQTIIIGLRPVVFRVVEEALIETSTTHLDSGDLTDMIIMQLTPIVEQGVQQESQALLASQAADLEDQVVRQVISSLKTTVIRIVQATVSTSGVDLTNVESLLQTILIQLKPVVRQEVENALRVTSVTGINAESLTNRIVLEITPFVRQALQQEVQKVQDNALSEDQVVQLIITDLKPTVIRIIQATVASGNVDLSNINQLLSTILVQLRPVVLNEVNSALATSTVAGNINANSLTDRIIREITNFVRQVLESEVQKATANLEDKVVKQVTSDLKPTVIRIIQVTVSSSGVDLSNVESLLETILTPLRPFVLEALRKEVEKVKEVETQKVQSQVVNQVKADLNNVIKQTVTASATNLGNTQGLVSTIIEQLRPVIFQAVKKALEASPFDIDAERLTIKIIVEITPFVETGVKEEVIKQKEQNDGLVKLLGGNLKTAITDAIQGLDLKSVS